MEHMLLTNRGVNIYVVLQYIAIKYNYYIYLVGAKIKYFYWSKANIVRPLQ